MYDVTNGESFFRIRRWIDEIYQYCDDSIAKVLIGNKDDYPSSDSNQVQKVVPTADAQQYAHQMSLAFFETSAKDNKNVNEAFYTVTRMALYRRLEVRRKAQTIQRTHILNGEKTSRVIRLKVSKKSKTKDKKYNETCCK